MKVAYVTNQYPKTSHAFIRREIAGIEAAGIAVERISVRRADEVLVERADRAESLRTRVLLGRGALGLLPDVLAVLVTRPLRALRALATAFALARSTRSGAVRSIAYFAEACTLLRWTRELGVEHVHAHFSTNPAAVALLCRELGGPPYSFTAHGTADFATRLADGLPRKIAGAAFVVGVSEDGRRRLLERTPRGHEHKVQVVHCGVDAPFLSTGSRPACSRARLVCVARLSAEKGIDVLLRATGQLASEGLAFELVLVGDGPERERLEALARELGLGDCARFAGWCGGADVRAHVLRARALVLASRSEGLPVVIMEALALGRPVIATAVGGIAELVVPGECGWIVPPGSQRALAEAMREALTSPPRVLDRMGRRGAERVAASHDAAKEARELARLFLDAGVRRDVRAARTRDGVLPGIAGSIG